MSACTFALDEYDGEFNDFSSSHLVKARKEHLCCECGRTIARGEQYENASGKTEGGLWRFHTCLTCGEIRDQFAPGGYAYTTLWEQIKDGLFPEMNFACMEGLSAAARTFLIERWQEWKGLRNA